MADDTARIYRLLIQDVQVPLVTDRDAPAQSAAHTLGKCRAACATRKFGCAERTTSLKHKYAPITTQSISLVWT